LLPSAHCASLAHSRWRRVEGFRDVTGDSSPPCWTEIDIFSEHSGVAIQIGPQRSTIYSFIESMFWRLSSPAPIA
jgi:hypothetical protein